VAGNITELDTTYLSNLLEVTERDDASVGADDVEAAPDLDGLIEESHGLGDLADIGLQSNGVGAQLLDLVDELLGRSLGVGVVHDDLGTRTAELGSHGSTDATTGAGDEGDLAIQAKRNVSTLGAHFGEWYIK
jgi:hypothetical protein